LTTDLQDLLSHKCNYFVEIRIVTLFSHLTDHIEKRKCNALGLRPISVFGCVVFWTLFPNREMEAVDQQPGFQKADTSSHGIFTWYENVACIKKIVI
jgi:hypothetical protein